MRTEKTIVMYQIRQSNVYGLSIFQGNRIVFDLYKNGFQVMENVDSIFDENLYKGRVFYGSKDWQNEVKTFSF